MLKRVIVEVGKLVLYIETNTFSLDTTDHFPAAFLSACKDCCQDKLDNVREYKVFPAYL